MPDPASLLLWNTHTKMRLEWVIKNIVSYSTEKQISGQAQYTWKWTDYNNTHKINKTVYYCYLWM